MGAVAAWDSCNGNSVDIASRPSNGERLFGALFVATTSAVDDKHALLHGTVINCLE
jgi:hypothetical protein